MLPPKVKVKKIVRIPKILPKQIPPKLIESDYAGHLVKRIINPARKAYAPLVRAIREKIAIAQKKASPEKKMDAIDDDDPSFLKDNIRDLLKEGARKLAYSVDQSDLDALAEKYANSTSKYQRTQLQRQLAGVLGTDPLIADKSLSSRVNVFVDHNVALVKRIPENLHDSLSDLVDRGFRESWAVPSLADEIMNRFNVAESHARLIARDQIGQLYADVNHDRQRNLGVTRFVWRTANDERVRGAPDGLYPKSIPSHAALDGMTFSYDDPPINEASGLPFLPGDDFQCRCYSEGILDDLLGGDDDDEPDDPSDDLGPDPEDDEDLNDE